MEFTESRVPAVQLEYARHSYAAPKYKFSRLVPLSGSQTVTMTPAGTQEVLIEIPTQVFNFDQSYLFANISYPAVSAAYTWAYTKGMPLLQEVDLYTRSGVYLCQLPNFQYYMDMVQPYNTPKEEFLTNDYTSFFAPSNALIGANAQSVTPNNGSASTNYLENNYLEVGSGTNTALNLNLNFSLNNIKRTIFSLNRNLVFPDIIVLRLLFAPSTSAYFSSTSNTDPTAGTAAAAGNVTITNLTLFLATEKNEDLAQVCREIVNSPMGLNLLVEYPYIYKQSLTGTTQNVSLRFNRGHGKNLLEVYTAPYNSSGAGNVAYDHWNMATPSTAAYNASAAKVQQYYSQLDNIRLQDINLNCANSSNDDYRENKRFCLNTAISGLPVYQQNWVHIDRFYEELPYNSDHTPKENLDKGMSLIVERKYDFLGLQTTNAQYNWYSIAIVQKDLHIGSGMIQYQ